jgi:MFS family permease
MRMTASSPLGDTRAAWFLAGVEFFFALSWVVYVIFLPELLARGGIDKRYLPWIIAADQLIFALADWWMGVAVDRARAALRRIGPLLVLLSAISALAMLLMPWLAATPIFFLLAISVWVATSSALRAPPYVLLSRYAGRATLPRLAGIQLLGLALASALAPYLAIVLKGVDPALPFLLSALAVAASALALVYVERRLPAAAPTLAAAEALQTAAGGAKASWAFLLLLALLLAFGQQVHSVINSAVQFKRLADPALLPWLMPVFWIGFSFGLLGVGRLVRARGPLQVLQVACALVRWRWPARRLPFRWRPCC